jgi:hypothetical protein
MKAPKLTTGALGQAGQWNSLVDDASGASSLLAHNDLGHFFFSSNPSNGQTITLTINGTAITLTGKTGTLTTAGDFKIQSALAATETVVINFLQNPWTTNANQVALSLANQELLGYVGIGSFFPDIVFYSLNTTMNAPLTSLSGSTTFTGGSYTTDARKLYVEPGTYYINGTQTKFTGGTTPAVTAPVSNPRIDLLVIDNTGTLLWVTGTESASPVPPTYPTYTKVPICELFNVVGETALYDLANQQAGQGYIQADVRAITGAVTDFTNISQDFIPDADNTRNLGSPSKEFATIYAHNILSGSQPVAFTKFAGSGADGALAISSGTTTINLGGASYFEKNYTSISITGSGQLTFSNPSSNGCVVVLKSQGNVTLTSSATPNILGDGLGASASTDGCGLSVGPGAPIANNVSFEQPGPATEVAYFVNGGIGVHVAAGPYARSSVFSGAGGGIGSNTANNGAGGTGGLGILIECGGALNFTSTITSKGSAGGNGSGSSSWGGSYSSAGGGGSSSNGGAGTSSNTGVSSPTTTNGAGGGGGGSVVILYNSVTANTGTVTVTGGAGGTGTGTNGAAGGNGFSFVGQNIFN